MRHPVLLVGSVPLQTSEQVFKVVGRGLGGLIGRLPDGETGKRLGFIAWAGEQISNASGLETDPDRVGPPWTGGKVFKVKNGTTAAQIDFGPHIYAEVARESYASFRRLREAGKIPAHLGFQVAN